MNIRLASKRIAAPFAAALAGALLAGCGSSTDEEGTEAPSSETTEEGSEEGTEDAPAEETEETPAE